MAVNPQDLKVENFRRQTVTVPGRQGTFQDMVQVTFDLSNGSSFKKLYTVADATTAQITKDMDEFRKQETEILNAAQPAQ